MRVSPIALDSKGNDTKIKLPFSEVHGPDSRSDIFCGTSHVWIYNTKGEVLLQKRSMNMSTHPGRWDVSAAGHIDFGENPGQAAVRETKEEIGIEIQPNQLEFLKKRKADTVIFPRKWHHNEFAWVYLLRLETMPENFVMQESEVKELRWISLDQLSKDVHEPAMSELFVPHGEYYDFIIQEVARRTNKSRNQA